MDYFLYQKNIKYILGSAALSFLGVAIGVFTLKKYDKKSANNKETIRSIILLGATGGHIVSLTYSLGKYLKFKIKERKLVNEVKSNSKWFNVDQEKNKVIFDNKQNNCRWILNSFNQFCFENKRENQELDILPKTIPSQYFIFYEAPSNVNLYPKFNSWEMIFNGSENFRNNKILIGGEILFLNDLPNSILPSLYEENAKKEIENWLNKNQHIDTWGKEKTIIKICGKMVYSHISEKNVTAFNEKPSAELIFKDIAEIFKNKKGECRHMASSLGYLLNRAIEDKFLSGTVNLEVRILEKSSFGHAWLTYKANYLPNFVYIDLYYNIMGICGGEDFSLITTPEINKLYAGEPDINLSSIKP